ncbi:MAG: hypothetical protein CVU39_04930 [Chloroflexi bacterium HGW-Chloroflexi-10]|nr:MAG: hypothetical protein CVU39_04930 [Chloroflexi bacterium HGW-Chloroflexi-10]
MSEGSLSAGQEIPTAEIRKSVSRTRIRIGLISTVIGFLLFLLGARPSLFGLDRSPVIGFVQIAVFLVGLGVMCLGGYLSTKAMWRDRQISIIADIGMRLVATGFVIAVFAGMADVFGFGSHPLPDVPYFGAWQARGVEIGEGIIAIGFLMMIPYFPQKSARSRTESTASI